MDAPVSLHGPPHLRFHRMSDASFLAARVPRKHRHDVQGAHAGESCSRYVIVSCAPLESGDLHGYDSEDILGTVRHAAFRSKRIEESSTLQCIPGTPIPEIQRVSIRSSTGWRNSFANKTPRHALGLSSVWTWARSTWRFTRRLLLRETREYLLFGWVLSMIFNLT